MNAKERFESKVCDDLEVLTMQNDPHVEEPEIAVIPKDFLRFKKLPTELQVKIWRDVARFPRFIEMRPNGRVVARRSLQPPPVLQVCHLARTEAQGIYDKATLNLQHIQTNLAKKYVYYNSNEDIVLLGDYYGNQHGISKVLATAMKIEKIAFYIEPRSGYDDRLPLFIMQTLHGDTERLVGSPVPPRSPGCTSLKEVFLVVKSRIWGLKSGEIDWSVSWRPPTSEGRYVSEIIVKQKLDHHINKVKNGVSLWKPHPSFEASNEWDGGKAPNFKFVSLAPLNTINGPVLDGLKISKYTFARLYLFLTSARVEKLNSSTGCRLIIPKYYEATRDTKREDLVTNFEFGMYGYPSAIEKAKVEIRKLVKFIFQSDTSRLSGVTIPVLSTTSFASELQEFIADTVVDPDRSWKYKQD